MNAEKVVATRPSHPASSCLHSRILENILDTYGNSTGTLRCCECGAIVVIHTQPAESS